jgi:hypothetical protein
MNLHKTVTKYAFGLRYTNSLRFLGDSIVDTCLLAYAKMKRDDQYAKNAF